MKAVLREMAQAKRHYSTLPLFEFLRDDSIPPRDRLTFYPCMAPFILAYSDLNRFVFRDEIARDPYQRLINERTYEADNHWPWYLEDLVRLGFDRTHSITQALRGYMKDEIIQGRMLTPRLAQLAHQATPVEKLVILESIEETGNVLFGLTAKIAARIQAEGGPVLRYETVRAMHGQDRGVLEAIALTEADRKRCLDFAFRVFDMFADWRNELHVYARRALAQRTTPHIVHGRTA
jgi:hypothetical protein